MEAGLCSGGALILSYLVGAVPFALVAGKIKGIDIRSHGSGNLGATNAIRVLGKPIGLTVFFLDFFKGAGPVLLIRAFPEAWILPPGRESWAFFCGLAAVLGHIIPVYLKFKGGKGVAASAGVFFLIRWDAALISFILFFLVRKCSGYVSLSSIALACSFPLALICLHPGEAFGACRWIVAGSAALALLIIVKHRSNLVRIKNGEEPKVKKVSDQDVRFQ